MDIEIKAQSVPAPLKRNPSPPIAVIAILCCNNTQLVITYTNQIM